MEIKGYVWGGSLHGQVTVQDSFEFVCVSRAVPAMEAVHLQADRSPAKRSDLVEIMESPFDLTGSHYLFNRHIQRG